jgi:HK97 family phage major capsid protein
VPKSIKELAEERSKLFADNKALLDKAEGEGRTLSADEQAEWDRRDAEMDKLGAELKSITDHETRKQRLAALEQEQGRPLPRQTSSAGGARTKTAADGEPLTLTYGRREFSLEPEHPLYSRATRDYNAGFRTYLTADKRPDVHQLGLQVANDPKGGYLVGTSFLSMLIKFIDDDVTMRRLGTVLPPTTAKNVGALSFDTDYADADWSAEVPATDIAEDDAARFGKREMTPHMLTKLIKCSKKLLRSNTSIGLETFIAQRAAYKFAITENKAFLTGSGSQRPLGVFVASDDGVPTSRDVTATNTTSFTADDLINLKYSLKQAYQSRATWLFHRDAMKMLRKLKDGNGQYLFAPGLAGTPDTLLERPIVLDENAPNTFTTGQYVAACADFSYYWIQDSPDWEVERLDELFTLKNQMGWLFRKETDAMPVLAEAFARLKLA